MVTHEITFRILLTPSRIRLTLFFLLLGALPRMAATGEVATLATYYPPPSAAYGMITVNGNAILASKQDRVYIGSMFDDQTFVGVGQDPEPPYRLRINGALRVDGCIWLPNTDDKFRCRWE